MNYIKSGIFSLLNPFVTRLVGESPRTEIHAVETSNQIRLRYIVYLIVLSLRMLYIIKTG